ncbi:porin [Burkholderia metallica]|uniref:porin n=1 Tax=Burkholderia metallica TaxID=488729 RepID=UPI000D1AD75D|nr:porin [Burkholderia metallica]
MDEMVKKSGDIALKKNTVFAVVLLAVTSIAHAQSSVTLYGRTDAGFLFQNQNGVSAAIGKTKSNLFVFNGAGGENTNIYGLLGKEELGGGFQVGFQLQGQFNIGTGALLSSGTIFSQFSNVYLKSAYGTIKVGQQIDPAYVAMAHVDPRDVSQAYSAAGWWNFLQGKSVAPSQTVFESNAISYSYSAKNLSGGVLYRFGNLPGALSQGRTISTGLVYDDGTLIASGSFLMKNDSTGTRDLRIWSVGGGVRLGDFCFRGLFTDYRLPQGNAVALIGTSPASHVIVGGGGVNWQLSPAQMLTAAYYFAENRQDTMDATGSYVISDAYSLSKATTIYGFVGLMTAKKGATGLTSLTTAALTSGYPGANTTSIGVGIVHRF